MAIPGAPNPPYGHGLILSKEYGDLKQAAACFLKTYKVSPEKYTYAMFHWNSR